jgi:hypothetical protein
VTDQAAQKQIDGMVAQPAVSGQVIEDAEGAKVPQTPKPVSIKARYYWKGYEEDGRVTIRGGRVIFLGDLAYRPLPVIEDGMRVFEAVYGDTLITMAEEDWQRLLEKAKNPPPERKRRRPPKGPWIKAGFKVPSGYPDPWWKMRGRVYLLEDGRVQFKDWYRRLRPTEEVEDGWRVFECREDGGVYQVLFREEDWQRLLKKAQKEARS